LVATALESESLFLAVPVAAELRALERADPAPPEALLSVTVLPPIAVEILT
jgi:hypothetical protein